MSRRKAKKDSATGNEFMVLFTSLSVILLAFFILLNSLAVMDQHRKRMALGSLVGGFGILPGGLHFDREGQLLLPGVPMLSKGEEQVTAIANLKRYLKRNRLDQDVEILVVGNSFRVSFREQVLFEPGGTLINPIVFPILDELASVIRRLNTLVRIEGHTDLSQPASNWQISLGRALTVREYLVHATGIEERLVLGVGRAHFVPKPGLPPNSEEHRRVEVVLDRPVWK